MAQSDSGELKKMLRMAVERPIHMAFAFGADGKAVIKMHKMTQPKALEKALKDESPDAKNHRFGMVSVDPQDPKVARFTVNKAVGGAARKLAAALKGTGFSKIQIVMEDGSVVEEDADGEEDMLASDGSGLAGPGAMMGDVAGALGAGGVGAAVGGAVAGMAPAVGGVAGAFGNALGGLAGTFPGAPLPGAAHPAAPHAGIPHPAPPHSPQHATAPPPPAKPPAGPDAAALTRELSGLVKAMLPVIAKAPEQKAVLTELATDAQGSLKRGDLPQAAAGMEILRQAINDLGGTAGTGAPPIKIGTPVHPADGRPPAHVGTHPGNGRPPPLLRDPSGGGAPHGDGNRVRPEGENDLDRWGGENGNDDVLGGREERHAGQRNRDDGDGRDGDEGRLRGEDQDGERHAGRQHDGGEGGGDLRRDAGMGEERHDGHGHKDHHHAHHHDPSVTRKLQKARMAWTATRAKVDADLQRLSKAIMEASDGDDMGDDIEDKFMEAVEPMLSELDEELSELLSRAVDAKDHQDRERLLTDARRTVARYALFVEGNPIIADLDDNPFMPLKIGKSLGTVLSTLSSVMR